MTPHFRLAKLDDVYDLAPRLRLADVEEIHDAAGLTALSALEFSFKNAIEVNSMIADDGEIIGMFGVNPTADPLLASAWMLCSDRLPEFKKEFLPQSLEWVKETNDKYPILFNYVAKSNLKAIRWLKYLGFTFVQLIEHYGYGQKPFYEFVRINDVCRSSNINGNS